MTQSTINLSARDVGLQREGRHLLSEINLQLQPGEVVALLGPNGAGKTTLVNILNGQLQPDTGSVTLAAKALNDWALSDKAKHQASLAQQSPLNFPYKVWDVVALGRLPHRSGQIIDRRCILAAMAAMDIEHLAGHIYTQLSGGEKQRVQLARVFTQLWPDVSQAQNQAGFLLLDEPTAALDLAHQQMVLKTCVERSQNNVAVLLVLHDINLALRFADRLVLMLDGRIVANDSPENIAKADLLEKVFGIRAEVIKHPIHGCPHVVF